MHRNSAKMLAIRSVEASILYVPTALIWKSSQDRLDGLWATLATVLFTCFTVSRLHSVFFDWWTTRYQVDRDGLRLATGFFVRKEIAVA